MRPGSRSTYLGRQAGKAAGATPIRVVPRTFGCLSAMFSQFATISPMENENHQVPEPAFEGDGCELLPF